MKRKIAISDEAVISKIYTIRNHRVMLDDDLAELYHVETRRLNEQVKRNIDRFPPDFMFQLTEKEWEILMSQIATSRWGGRRKTPYVFTEHGVLMLSSILKSDRAIQVNIQIMRIYSRLRGVLIGHKDILIMLERLERKVDSHDEDLKVVFDHLRKLLNPKTQPLRKIGFRQKTSRPDNNRKLKMALLK